MMMIVLHLRSLLGLKSRWKRHFRPRPLNKVCFFRGPEWLDSWTPGPKPLCHRHPTGPHSSGLLWTPWTPAKGDSTNTNFALVLPDRGRLARLMRLERAGRPRSGETLPFHPGQRPLHGGAFGGDLADQDDLLGAAMAAVLAEIDALGQADAGAAGAQPPAAAARQAHQHGLA